MSVWNIIKPYFERYDGWGDPDKMDGTLLLLLYHIRVETNWPIIINCGYATTGHSPTGYHPKGMAVDFHFGSKVDEPIAQQAYVLRHVLRDLQADNFVGLGVYPDWHRPGFHLDTRGKKARWGRLNGKYIGFDEALKCSK